MYRPFTLMIFMALCLTFASPVLAQGDEPPRTYYDTLDLSSPEAAVTTFADAFQRDDFFTVYLVLHPDAQLQFEQDFNAMKYDVLYNTSRQELVEPDVPLLAEGSTEHIPEGIFTFDDLIYSASRHNALLIDLRGGVDILRTEETDTGADVTTSVGGINGDVIFRMMQSVSGKWRVRQVIVPGGNEEQIPWSAP